MLFKQPIHVFYQMIQIFTKECVNTNDLEVIALVNTRISSQPVDEQILKVLHESF